MRTALRHSVRHPANPHPQAIAIARTVEPAQRDDMRGLVVGLAVMLSIYAMAMLALFG